MSSGDLFFILFFYDTTVVDLCTLMIQVSVMVSLVSRMTSHERHYSPLSPRLVTRVLRQLCTKDYFILNSR